MKVPARRGTGTNGNDTATATATNPIKSIAKGNGRGHKTPTIPTEGIFYVNTHQVETSITTDLPNATRANSRPYRIRVPKSLKEGYRAFMHEERGHRFTGWNFRKCMRSRQFCPLPLPDQTEKPTERMTIRLLPEDHKAFVEFCEAWKVPQWVGFWLLVATTLTVFDRPIEPEPFKRAYGEKTLKIAIPDPSKREAILMAIRTIVAKRGKRFTEREFRREATLIAKMLDETDYDLPLVVRAYRDALEKNPDADARYVFKHRERLFGKWKRIREEQVTSEERKRRTYDRPAIIPITVRNEGSDDQTIGQNLSYTTTTAVKDNELKVSYETPTSGKQTATCRENGFSGNKSESWRIIRQLIALRDKPIEPELWDFSKREAKKLLEETGYDTELATTTIKLALFLYPKADFRFIRKHRKQLITLAAKTKQKRDELRASRRETSTYYHAGMPRRATKPKRESTYTTEQLRQVLGLEGRKPTAQVAQPKEALRKQTIDEKLAQRKQNFKELQERISPEIKEAKEDPLLTLCPIHRHFVKFCPEDCYHAQKIKEGRVKDHPTKFPEGYFELCEGCGKFKRKCTCQVDGTWTERMLMPILNGFKPVISAQTDPEAYRRIIEEALEETPKQLDEDQFALCEGCGKFVRDCKCEIPRPIKPNINRLMMEIRRMHERENQTPTEPTQRKGLYDNVGTNYLERLYENEREERNELRCPNCNRPVAKGDGDIVACLWCRKEFYDLEGMLIEVEEK